MYFSFGILLPGFLQGSSFRIPWTEFSSRTPTVRFLLHNSSSRAPSPGFLLQDSSQTFFHQDSSSEIPLLELLAMDYLPNAHETYGFSLLCMTCFFFVLRMVFFVQMMSTTLWATYPLRAHKTYACSLLWMTWVFFVLRMGFFCTTDGVFLYHGWVFFVLWMVFFSTETRRLLRCWMS